MERWNPLQERDRFLLLRQYRQPRASRRARNSTGTSMLTASGERKLILEATVMA